MWCNAQVTYSSSPNKAPDKSKLKFNSLYASTVLGEEPSRISRRIVQHPRMDAEVLHNDMG
jgi:hypothetical protein